MHKYVTVERGFAALRSVGWRSVGDANFRRALETITRPEGLVLHSFSGKKAYLFRLDESEGPPQAFVESLRTRLFPNVTWVGVRGEVCLHLNPRPDGSAPEVDEGEATALATFVLAREIQVAFFALNLAMPGSINLLDVGFVDESRSRSWLANVEMRPGWTLRADEDDDEVDTWPQLEQLSFDDVWAYLMKLRGVRYDVSATPVERAINALSRALDELDSSVQLVWAVMGLEALYCEGAGGKVELLLERLGVFVELSNAHRKKIRQMYRVRSSMLHGGMDFSSVFWEGSDGPRELKFLRSTESAARLATRLLCLSVQILVDEDLAELKFRTVLAE